MNFLMQMLGRHGPEKAEPTKADKIAQLLAQFPTPTVHDLRIRYWGNSIEKCGDTFALWTTPTLRKGDHILTAEGRFVAFSVRYCNDPPDMVFADFWKVDEAAKHA